MKSINNMCFKHIFIKSIKVSIGPVALQSYISVAVD